MFPFLSLLQSSTTTDANLSLILIYDCISIGLSGILIIFLTSYILYYFTNKGPLKYGVYICLGFSYFISFLSLALVSIDLATGLHATHNNEDISDINYYFVILWRIIYWSIQLMSWIINPFNQSFEVSGEFTFILKVLRAIWENLISYIIYGVVFGAIGAVFVIYLLVSNSMLPAEEQTAWSADAFLGLALSASSAVGMVLFCFFIGYASAELPKFLWNIRNNERNLRYLEFQAGKCFDEVADAEEDLIDELSHLRALEEHVEQENKLRPLIQKMKNWYENELQKYDKQSQRERGDPIPLSRNNLVKLNKRILACKRGHRKAIVAWQHLLKRAFFLQDILEAKQKKEWTIQSSFRRNVIRNKLPFLKKIIDPLEYFYHVHFAKWFFRILSIGSAFLCLIIIWNQLTPIVYNAFHVNISIFYWTIQLFVGNWFALTALSFTITISMALLVYFTMFNLRIFSIYQLLPHYTDSYSMLFTNVFLCRVIPMLCFNYINIIGVESISKEHPQNIAFVQFMGTIRLGGLKLLGNLGGYFADYFPLIIPFITFVFMFNLVERFASCCGFENRFVYDTSKRSMNDENIAEGKELLQKERERELKLIKEYGKNGKKSAIMDWEDRMDNPDHFVLDERDLEMQLEGGRNNRRTKSRDEDEEQQENKRSSKKQQKEKVEEEEEEDGDEKWSRRTRDMLKNFKDEDD